MYIKINDRDVAPQNVAAAVLERPVVLIHFQIGENFTFENAFEAMVAMGEALGVVNVGEREGPLTAVKISDQEEFDFSQGALTIGSEELVSPPEGKEFLTSSTAIIGDVDVVAEEKVVAVEETVVAEETPEVAAENSAASSDTPDTEAAVDNSSVAENKPRKKTK